MKLKENAKEIGSTLQRYRYDMKIFLFQTIPKKPRNDLKRPRMTSNDANENDKPVSKKIKTKNSSKGGDANDVNTSNGSVLIEPAFCYPKTGSV